MALTFNASIPLSDGSQIQIVPDTSAGGFILMNYINASGETVSSTALSQNISRSLVNELNAVNSARSAQISAGI